MKKIVSVLLLLATLSALFAGCAKEPAATVAKTPTTQAPAETTAATEETEPTAAVIPDDGVLKVLLIGHSLGNDTMWMLPEVFMNEAPDTKVVLGFLYYSGCALSQHVAFAQNESAVYGYAEFNSETDTMWQVAQMNGTFQQYQYGRSLSGAKTSSGISQTSKFAIKRQDWDIIIMQANPWEAANLNVSRQVNIIEDYNTMKAYVLENDIEKGTIPQFGWNAIWTWADDETVMRPEDKMNITSTVGTVDAFYEKMFDVLEQELVPVLDFAFVIPSAATYCNALTSYLEPLDMHRDYAHATDYGRMMIAYLVYCTLTDTDITECKLEPISWEYMKNEISHLAKEDLVLTESQKLILIESISNAMKSPYATTPSQYTEAPAE